MKLTPIDSPELLRLVAGWMSDKANYQWLDFGNGRRAITPEWLKIMTQRNTDILKVFTDDTGAVPIGVAGLNAVDRDFKTAQVWAVLGDKSYARQGYATRAVSHMLTLAFQELGLHAVSTWAVEGNPSIRIPQQLNFTFIGRQRQCHYIDGRPRDRIWFDILASEHKEA